MYAFPLTSAFFDMSHVRCLDSVMSLVSVTKISSLMLASVVKQARFLMTRLVYMSIAQCCSINYLHQEGEKKKKTVMHAR